MRELSRPHVLRGFSSILVLLLLIGTTFPLRALEPEAFDSCKICIEGFCFYSNPSGDIQGSANSGTINLQKDLGFNSYSTFSGKVAAAYRRKEKLLCLRSLGW
jgi:hypothetical protein